MSTGTEWTVASLERRHHVIGDLVADRPAWRTYRRVTRRAFVVEATRYGCRVVSGRAVAVRRTDPWVLRGLDVHWRVRLAPLTDAQREAIRTGPDLVLRFTLATYELSTAPDRPKETPR